MQCFRTAGSESNAHVLALLQSRCLTYVFVTLAGFVAHSEEPYRKGNNVLTKLKLDYCNAIDSFL